MSNLENLHSHAVSITIAGKELSLSPLTMKDLSHLEHFCRYYEYLALKELGTVGEELDAIRDKCLTRLITADEFGKLTGGFTGGLELTWLSIRKKHPEITKDWLADHLTLEELQGFSKLANDITVTGPVEDEKKTVDDNPK